MNFFCVRSSAVTVQGHALAGITLLILAFPLTTLAVAGPFLRITEAMRKSGTGGTEDWIEITNTVTQPPLWKTINLTTLRLRLAHRMFLLE